MSITRKSFFISSIIAMIIVIFTGKVKAQGIENIDIIPESIIKFLENRYGKISFILLPVSKEQKTKLIFIYYKGKHINIVTEYFPRKKLFTTYTIDGIETFTEYDARNIITV